MIKTYHFLTLLLSVATLRLCSGQCGQQYTIVAGDICDQISQNNGLSLDDFLALNPGLDCSNLQIGQSVCIQGSSGGSTPPPPDNGGGGAPTGGQCDQQYTIQAGDICDTISQNYGLSLDDFLALNPGLDCSNLQIGQNVCLQESGGGSTPPDNGGGDSPPPTGQPLVSFDQFSAAVTATNGYPAPSQDQYNNFINNYASAGGISSLRELAMFLAEILWESGGLQYKAEIACQQDGCPNDYRSPGDDPSKFYYGRGYIQLSWSYNYKAASEALFGDDRLVTDPDQVATDDNIAWQTAFWFWKTNVHPDPGVQNGQFGSATNKINGALECNPCQGNCSKRNDIYAAVLKAFGDDEQPNYAGC